MVLLFYYRTAGWGWRLERDGREREEEGRKVESEDGDVEVGNGRIRTAGEAKIDDEMLADEKTGELGGNPSPMGIVKEEKEEGICDHKADEKEAG